eukprot:g79155.t1
MIGATDGAPEGKTALSRGSLANHNVNYKFSDQGKTGIFHFFCNVDESGAVYAKLFPTLVPGGLDDGIGLLFCVQRGRNSLPTAINMW